MLTLISAYVVCVDSMRKPHWNADGVLGLLNEPESALNVHMSTIILRPSCPRQNPIALV